MAWIGAALLACLLLAPAAPAAPLPPPNLLSNPLLNGVAAYPLNVNGGNISGLMPDGWADNTEWAGPEIKLRYTPQAGAACGGRFAAGRCLQAAIGGTFMQWGQFLQLPAGRSYRLSIWLRAALPPGGRAGIVSLHLRQMGDPYTDWGQVSALVGPAWTQLTLPYAAIPPGRPANAPTDSFFEIIAGGPATLWAADASLVQLAPNTPQPALALAPPQVPIPRQYFGMNANGIYGFQWWTEKEDAFSLTYAWPQAQGLDFGIFRTWDSGVVWATIQPFARGAFVWVMLDYYVAQAQKRGQKVMFTLGQTPAWASSQPTLPSVYGPGLGSPPADIEDWKAFVRALARRYRGRIHFYEVWNEPDIQGDEGFFNGSPLDLVKLEAATAEVLSEEDPAALLLTPPMSGGDTGGALQWLRRYLEAGGGQRAGALAWHAYTSSPEASISVVDIVRKLLVVHGLARLPVWNTEGGLDLESSKANATSSAGFVSRSLIVHWGLGLKASCWYAYYSSAEYEGLTVLRRDGTRDPSRLNAAGFAYRNTMVWLLGARMTSLSASSAGIWTAELLRPPARRGAPPSKAWIVWSPSALARLVLPAAWKANSWADVISGLPRPIKGAGRVELLVGEVPILVSG